jgi:hypothetical protein
MKRFIISSCVILFLCSSFFTASSSNSILNKTVTTTERAGNYYIYVHVSHPDGGNYSGIRVQGEVCGILGGMTSSDRTDSNGNARITFASTDAICTLFVNGKGYDGKWKHGSTAYFTVR